MRLDTTDRFLGPAICAAMAFWLSCDQARATSNLVGCTEEIQADLNNMRTVQVDYDCALTQTLTIPAGRTLRGRGALSVGAASLLTMLDATGGTGTTIEELAIDGGGQAVAIFAQNTDDLRLVDLTITNAKPNGVYLVGVRDFTAQDLRVTDSWSDGLAARGAGANYHINGGVYAGNGLDPNSNGNGIDLNPGGVRARITSVSLVENDGAGIVIEGGPQALVDATVETDVQLIGLDSRHNTGAGVEVVRRLGPHPFPHRISIVGGAFVDNEREGLFLLGHGINVTGAIVAGNGRHGVVVPELARDVSLVGVYAAGNGAALPVGSAAAAYVDGTRVRVDVRAAAGFSDWVLDDTTLASGPQANGVKLGPNARAVTISGDASQW